MIRKGLVKNVTFHNPENGYSVLRLEDPDTEDIFTVVGNFPQLSIGEHLELEGNWVEHGTFGYQLQCRSYRILPPDTPEAIERYLSGGTFKGVGPKQAKLIVERFGRDTFRVLDEEPSRLEEIPRLKAKKRENLMRQWLEQRGAREVMYFLQAHGLSLALSNRLYQHYGSDTVKLLKENPFRLAEDLWGIGFLKADSIARKLGYPEDSYPRIQAGLSHALNRSSEEGHVFLTREELMRKAIEVLGCDESLVVYTLDNLVKSSEIQRDEEGHFYRPYLFHSEAGIARCLRDLCLRPRPIAPGLIAEGIDRAEHALPHGFRYSSEQKSGIAQAVNSGAFVLTGGPGTGKTTTVMGILEVFRTCEFRLRLAAPTGRAAKRLAEVTGTSAATIHRLLKYDPAEGGFTHNEGNYLETDVLIVDEVSMIDTVLMYSLLKALEPGTRMILVGDPDQLPSVGPGKVLAELINSQVVPHLHLGRIFRQAEGSLIVTNAHRINRGLMPEIRSGGNFHFRRTDRVEESLEWVEGLVCRHLPTHFHYNPLTDIQVLTPMNRGPLGTVALNALLQSRLNRQEAGIEHKDRRFMVHDKVMQLKNNYDKAVFNGDVGFVTGVFPKQKIVKVRFEEIEVEYAWEELDQLNLAYAATIHKSQGSEFRAVVVLLTNQHYVMLQRNLLYTAVTRAKERLFLIGQDAAIRRAVENNPIIFRNTRLSQRLTLQGSLLIQ